jgi:hypothetical protein
MPHRRNRGVSIGSVATLWPTSTIARSSVLVAPASLVGLAACAAYGNASEHTVKAIVRMSSAQAFRCSERFGVARQAGEEWPHTQNKPDVEFLVARLGVVGWDTLHLRKGKKYRIGP